MPVQKGRGRKKSEPQIINLDIACGQRKQEGYIGIDRADIPGVDIVHDLTVYPWPISDCSVKLAYCSHYVEHIPMIELQHMDKIKDAFFAFFDEVYRVLIPEGQITILSPFWSSVRSWQDPTHRRAISDNSFLYLNRGWRVNNGLDHYPVDCNFDFGSSYILDATWGNRNEEMRTFAATHYVNVISDVQVTLIKRE